jgi:hypothetical protein
MQFGMIAFDFRVPLNETSSRSQSKIELFKTIDSWVRLDMFDTAHT